MTNLDNVLERRDITLLTKVCLVKAVVFPVVIYGCESWTIKKKQKQKQKQNNNLLSTKELMLLNSGIGEDS